MVLKWGGETSGNGTRGARFAFLATLGIVVAALRVRRKVDTGCLRPRE
jgi:hypothetical protein